MLASSSLGFPSPIWHKHCAQVLQGFWGGTPEDQGRAIEGVDMLQGCSEAKDMLQGCFYTEGML